MSMSVVRSKARGSQAIVFTDVENLSSDFEVDFPLLDSSSPMPADFNMSWEASRAQFEKLVAANERQSAVQLAEQSHLPTVSTKVATWWGDLKYKATTMMSGAVLLAAGSAVFLTPFTMAWTSSNPDYWYAAVMTSMLGFLPVIPAALGITLVVEKFQSRVKFVLDKAFDSGYEERITRWASERYGVVIPKGVWTTSSVRMSKDIAYLGVKDGENVYCQERPEGWVLTYNDGTELPVIVEQKELVEA